MLVKKIIKNFRDTIKKLTQRNKQNGAQKNVSPSPLAEQAIIRQEKETLPDHKKKRRPRRKKGGPLHPPPSAPHSLAEPILWDDSQFKVPPEKEKTRFHDLNLPNEIMHAVADIGFKYCTPVQADVLRKSLTGRDATGRAQTGTGKTAAFLITILTNLLRRESPAKRRHGTPRALILAPTRELVLQIVQDARLLAKYCSLEIVGVLGGMDYQKQQRQLTEQMVDIVVATPGRLLDFQRQKYVHLDKVEILVIDEADRMLDMGFIPDVRRIVYSTPQKDKRQTLLFSATLTDEVTNLSSQWTTDPVVVEIEPEQVVTETVKQLVYLVTNKEKFALLYNIISGQKLERVIVFCNRRDETRDLTQKLKRYGISCALLSGEVPQDKRVRTLENFKAGKIKVLVATDVAGRGIHIEGVSHVINYTLPYEAEDYVHRIGRTGRAGVAGTSVSFADENDSFYLPDIEEFIGNKLHCIRPEDEWLKLPTPTPVNQSSNARKPKPKGSRRVQHRGKRPYPKKSAGRSFQK